MIHDSDAEADNSEYGLRLGARGWQHPHWQSTFYPIDLPHDWQLGFYANEFTALLVPAQYWPQNYEVEQWCDDVSARFRFYLEYSAVDDEQTFVARCRDFGPLLGGVISDIDRSMDLDCPLYVLPNSDQPLTLLKAVNDKAATLAMIKLGDADLRQQRQWLDNLHLQSENLAAVLVSDNELAIEKLQSLKTLIELMGF